MNYIQNVHPNQPIGLRKYRDTTKTLLDSDIADLHENIVSIIENKFSTKLRD